MLLNNIILHYYPKIKTAPIWVFWTWSVFLFGNEHTKKASETSTWIKCQPIDLNKLSSIMKHISKNAAFPPAKNTHITQHANI